MALRTIIFTSTSLSVLRPKFWVPTWTHNRDFTAICMFWCGNRSCSWLQWWLGKGERWRPAVIYHWVARRKIRGLWYATCWHRKKRETSIRRTQGFCSVRQVWLKVNLHRFPFSYVNRRRNIFVSMTTRTREDFLITIISVDFWSVSVMSRFDTINKNASLDLSSIFFPKAELWSAKS